MAAPWITFDCFGTLVDWNSGFADILEPIAGSRTPELIRAYHHFERLVETERPHRLYKDVLVTSLLRAASSLGLGLSEAQAKSVPQSWGSLPVFDGVEEMLQQLRAMGCRLAVLTNCDEDLFEVTHRQFRERFELVITAEGVRDYKPSLSHFRSFAEVSGASHADWVHVACSFYHDIEPARKLGIRRIWFDRDRIGEDPTVATGHVHSAPQVCACVGRLLAS